MKKPTVFVAFALVATVVILGHAPARGVDAPPPNDRFGDAITITDASCTVGDLTFNCAGTNAGATRQPGEPDHAAALGTWSVWYRWTPSFTGTARIAVWTHLDERYSQVVAVYRGYQLTALTELASSNNLDASDSFGDYLFSTVYVPVTAGTTYRIAVGGGTFVEGTLGDPFGIGPFHLSVRGYPFAWSEEVVDGAGGVGRTTGEIGRYPCAARQGTLLNAFYYDVPAGNLRHATYDGTTWT